MFRLSSLRRCKPAMDSLSLLEAHEVVAMLRAGSVSPLELIDVVERRISATEPLVHATPITCFERARERAQQLENSPPQTGRGFLRGLPVLIKDPSQWLNAATQHRVRFFHPKWSKIDVAADWWLWTDVRVWTPLRTLMQWKGCGSLKAVSYTQSVSQKRMRKGAIIVGKTNVPEFCAGWGFLMIIAKILLFLRKSFAVMQRPRVWYLECCWMLAFRYET